MVGAVTEAPERPARGRALFTGAAAGVIVTILVLTTSPAPPPSINWPSASQVENVSGNLTPRNVDGVGTSALAPDCTTVLVDVDSNVSVGVWVTQHDTTISYNATVAPDLSPYYYWSGPTGVEQVREIVTVTNPSAGITLAVMDASYTQNGTAYFGLWFPASDCS